MGPDSLIAATLHRLALPPHVLPLRPSAPAPPRVAVVHDAVPGRLRLGIPGLRRCAALAQAIEARLAGEPAVREVSANPLSGNVLLRHDTQHSVAEMLTIVERAVAACRAEQPPSPARAADRDLPPPTAAAPSRVLARAAAPAWHVMPEQEVFAALASSRCDGLSQVAAEAALLRHGPNTLPRPEPRSSWAILLGQFQSLPVMLLLGSAALATVTGGFADAAVIVGVVLINAGIGYATESRTERTIQSLADTRRRPTLVLRDGRMREIDADGLVPGDVVALVPGARVAADVRLLEARNLSIDESALTGESVPVSKHGAPLAEPEAPLGERVNMAYMGTIVTGGSGLGIVVGTGLATEIGAIQSLVSETRPPETPMQRQLDRLGTQLTWLSAGTCAIVFVVGLLRGLAPLQMLSAAVSLAVAAVPEGLPTVATTTLALGVQRMRRHRVLVRQLDAVETLGATQVVCLDKTGTLTANHMSVLALQVAQDPIRVAEGRLWCRGTSVDPYADDAMLRLIDVAVLCSEVRLEGGAGAWVLDGSGTERALVEFALACGIDVAALRRQYPLCGLEHRAQGRNYMRSVHRRGDGATLVAIKGSPAEVLALCRWQLVAGRRCALTAEERAKWLADNDCLAGEGLRVLGFAYHLAEDGEPPDAAPTWLGLAGLADPVRRGVAELIALFHAAGLKTVMITGDQSATAFAIGKALGLSGARGLEIMDSTSLDKLDPELLASLVERVDIFARVSPAHKLQIVQGLQRAGKVVAMTGDGINDGPALRAADIGIAMGASGTDTARSVADIVIEDDDLATMIVAVAEGRTIYNNIRKSLHFLLATNMSEMLTMLGALTAGMGQPLNTMQLLWINLVTDVFPALALAVEPPEPDVLRMPPRDPQEPIVRPGDVGRYAREAITLTAGTLGAYGYGLARYGAGPQASTLAFTTVVAGQMFHAWSCRSDTHGLFTPRPLPPNPYLKLALGATAGLQALALSAPGLRSLLGTAPLGPLDLGAVLTGACVPFLVNEAAKRPTGAREYKAPPAAAATAGG
jgi:Ca2+-transporting ATPase